MYDSYLSAATDIVQSGVREAEIPLSRTLETYLAHALARFFKSPFDPDLLTVRLARVDDAPVRVEALRVIGDECLIATALFEKRIRRNGSVASYARIGKTAYHDASLVEQAYGFEHMRDVVVVGARAVSTDIEDLVALALSDHPTADRLLRAKNVVVGPWRR